MQIHDERPTHLLIVEERPQYGGSDVFAHVRLLYCRLEAERAAPSFYMTAGFSELGFACQIDDKASRDSLSYGWTHGVRGGSDCHPIDLYKLEASVPILRKAEKAADKVYKLYGTAATFGAFVARRVAHLKLEGTLIRSVDARGYTEGMIDGLPSKLDSIVWALACECRRMKHGNTAIPATRDVA